MRLRCIRHRPAYVHTIVDTDHDLLELLDLLHPGTYIVEVIAGVRILWRISGTEPDDQPFDPAPDRIPA